MAGEIDDVFAYRSFLKGMWEHPHASMTLVALHNIVTKSIDRKWFSAGRGLTYCYTEVEQQLRHVIVGSAPAVPHGLDQAAVDEVPGLGLRATPRCRTA